MTDFAERSVVAEFEGQRVEHVLVASDADPQPCVILFPTVMGVNELELGFARRLAAKGRTAFVADLFGKRFTPVVDRERSEEHTSELQSRLHLVCRLLLEKK